MEVHRLGVALAACALLLTLACQGGDGDEPSPGATPPTTPAATPSTSPSPGATEPSDGDAGDGEPTGKIAFVSFRDGDRNIYVVNADGSGLTNLTPDSEAEDFDPSWSPDGRQLAFASGREGSSPRIFVMDADGSNVRPLTVPGGDLGPRWSPDGESIAFSRGGTVMVIDADGGNQRTLVEPGDQATAEPCDAGGFPGGWSPDSRRLIYYSGNLTAGLGQLCLVDVESGEVEVLGVGAGGLHVEPVWSPDESRIVYRSIRTGEHEIFSIDLEGENDTNLTNSPGLDVEPALSPDGGWIAFGSDRGGNLDVYIMRKDGSDVRRLTDDPAKDSYPTWAP